MINTNTIESLLQNKKYHTVRYGNSLLQVLSHIQNFSPLVCTRSYPPTAFPLWWDDIEELENYTKLSHIQVVKDVLPEEKVLFHSSSFPATLLSRCASTYKRTVKYTANTVTITDELPEKRIGHLLNTIIMMLVVDDNVFIDRSITSLREAKQIMGAAKAKNYKCYATYISLNHDLVQYIEGIKQSKKVMLTDQWASLFIPKLDSLDESDYVTYIKMLKSQKRENIVMALNLLSYYNIQPYLCKLKSDLYSFTDSELDALQEVNNVASKWLMFVLKQPSCPHTHSYLRYILMVKNLPLYTTLIQQQIKEVAEQYLLDTVQTSYSELLQFLNKKVILVNDADREAESSNREMETE